MEPPARWDASEGNSWIVPLQASEENHLQIVGFFDGEDRASFSSDLDHKAFSDATHDVRARARALRRLNLRYELSLYVAQGGRDFEAWVGASTGRGLHEAVDWIIPADASEGVKKDRGLFYGRLLQPWTSPSNSRAPLLFHLTDTYSKVLHFLNLTSNLHPNSLAIIHLHRDPSESSSPSTILGPTNFPLSAQVSRLQSQLKTITIRLFGYGRKDRSLFVQQFFEAEEAVWEGKWCFALDAKNENNVVLIQSSVSSPFPSLSIRKKLRADASSDLDLDLVLLRFSRWFELQVATLASANRWSWSCEGWLSMLSRRERRALELDREMGRSGL